jgi:hypothetical protein
VVRDHDLVGGRTAVVTGPIGDHVRSTISADGRTLAVLAGRQVRLYRLPAVLK